MYLSSCVNVTFLVAYDIENVDTQIIAWNVDKVRRIYVIPRRLFFINSQNLIARVFQTFF